MLNGIDVSSNQKNMNVSTYSCDFVICKATEGTGYVNPFCDIHYQQAKSSGKLLGVYHYARPDTGNSPEAEVDYFLRNITGYIGEAILALDLECDGWQKYSEWTKKWLDRVYEKTGVRPLFYSSGDGFANFKDMVNAGNYGVWAASDGNWYDGTTVVIKQSVYDGLDHDVFYGDAAAWHKYANPDHVIVHTDDQIEEVAQTSHVTEVYNTGINVGDNVHVTNAVTYGGQIFKTWYDTYQVMELKGDRAVIGVNGTVTAAINVNNLSKTGGSYSSNTSINVGDRVRVTNAVAYDGRGFKTWFDTYTVMELKGDRAVIGVNGTVTAAINVNNLSKV